jgi:hypothetical protein
MGVVRVQHCADLASKIARAERLLQERNARGERRLAHYPLLAVAGQEQDPETRPRPGDYDQHQRRVGDRGRDTGTRVADAAERRGAGTQGRSVATYRAGRPGRRVRPCASSQ